MKADNSAPEYLLGSQRRRGLLDGVEPSNLMVKIGDLGGGMICISFCRTRYSKTHILQLPSSDNVNSGRLLPQLCVHPS